MVLILNNDLKLGLGNSNFYEKIETNSTASARQQAQEGDYWDSFLNLNFDYDKRTKNFKLVQDLDLIIQQISL